MKRVIFWGNESMQLYTLGMIVAIAGNFVLLILRLFGQRKLFQK